MSTFHLNIVTCHRCPHRGRPCGDVPCVCTIDGESLNRHAEAGACPAGMYTGEVPAALPPTPETGRGHSSAEQVNTDRERWPRRIRLLARFAKSGERGVGDTLARLLGKVGGEVWKTWYQRLTGKDCGCGDRQGRLNERYPYGPG